MQRRALITGITGQDGSYLAEYLFAKGYKIYGLVRSAHATLRIPTDNQEVLKSIELIEGDLTDTASLARAIEISQPDEIYNLAAQSVVSLSFERPEETWNINYHGFNNLIEEAYARFPNVRVYQASSSEMFGSTPAPQSETSPLNPVSPYGESKTKAHVDLVQGNRRDKGWFIVSGILFNHESPRRGENFVTRKITRSLANIKKDLQSSLSLGNLDARRDWGFAGDYVEAMHAMLTQEVANDYVISTGKSHSVRDFVSIAAEELGIPITWEHGGIDEIGKAQDGKVVVTIDPQFYRPREVNETYGDIRKAREQLGWEPRTSFEDLVRMMVRADFDRIS